MSHVGYSQLNVVDTEPAEEIGEVKNFTSTALKATKRGEDYTILYKDAKFQHLDEYKSFSMNEQAFNELYDLLMSKWDNPPKEDIMIKLEEGYLWLSFTRMLGTTNVKFGHAVDENADVIGFSQWLTKRKIDKLFGK